MHESEQDQLKRLTDSIGDITETLGALYVQITRVYDVQLTLLSKIDPDLAKEIEEIHERGVVLTPPPLLLGDKDIE